jgi:hypothetical protein
MQRNQHNLQLSKPADKPQGMQRHTLPGCMLVQHAWVRHLLAPQTHTSTAVSIGVFYATAPHTNSILPCEAHMQTAHQATGLFSALGFKSNQAFQNTASKYLGKRHVT